MLLIRILEGKNDPHSKGNIKFMWVVRAGLSLWNGWSLGVYQVQEENL
jgi:hypothetical protein